MLFESPRAPLQVPAKDILSFIFDDWQYSWDVPKYIDADQPSNTITSRQLLDLTKRIGKGLRDFAGVKPGEVVLMSTLNGILVPPTILGILCASAIFSGANPRYTETELAYQIKDTGSKVILAGKETLETALRSVKDVGLPSSSIYLITLDKGPISGVRTLGDLLLFGELEWERISSHDEMKRRVAVLNYSSGTTGLPKGVKITVWNSVVHCLQQSQVRDLGREGLRKQGVNVPAVEKVLAFLPFYHAYGQQHFIFSGLRNGHIIYVMSSFNFPKMLEYIAAYGIHSFSSVPPVAVLLGKHPDTRRTDFSNVLPFPCGAAPLGAEMQLQAEEAMNAFKKGCVKISQGWGMSEVVCAGINFAMHERDPDVSGVGFLISGMSAKLLDDEGRELGYDEPGELIIKGPNVFAGYWKKEKETRESFTEDGWFKTGDIALVKKSGIFHIVDRKKELIKVKGLQVAPAELEDLLLKSPDVEDVAVIGIPAEGTEHPRAYVVPSPSRSTSDRQALARDIVAFISERVTRHKHITGGVVFVDAIPKNPSGKILRRQLRDRKGDKVWADTARLKSKL